MRLQDLNTDEAILKEIGKRLQRRRSSLGQNQSDIADLAILSRSTVSKIENGHATQTPEFFRYAKAVGLLELLEEILPEETISPLSFIKKKGSIKSPKGNLSARDLLRSTASYVEKRPRSRSGKGGFVWPEDRETAKVSEKEDDDA